MVIPHSPDLGELQHQRPLQTALSATYTKQDAAPSANASLEGPALDGLLEAFIAQQREQGKQQQQQQPAPRAEFPAYKYPQNGVHSQQSSLGRRRQSASESEDSVLMTPRNSLQFAYESKHEGTPFGSQSAFARAGQPIPPLGFAHGAHHTISDNATPINESHLEHHSSPSFVPEHGHNTSITSVASFTSNGSLELDDCTKSTSNVKRSPPPMTVDHRHICRWPNCGWSFKRFEHLKRHMLIHSRERPYMCDYPGCTKGFSRSDNFAAHYRTHRQRGVVGKQKRGAYSLRACKADGLSPESESLQLHNDMSGMEEPEFEPSGAHVSLGSQDEKEASKGRIQSRHLVSPPYAAHMMAHSMSVANAALASAGLSGLGDDYPQPATPTRKGLGITSQPGAIPQPITTFTPPHIAFQKGHTSQNSSMDPAVGLVRSMQQPQYETSRTTAEILRDQDLLREGEIELNPQSDAFGQIAPAAPFSRMMVQNQSIDLGTSSQTNSPATPFTPASRGTLARSQMMNNEHMTTPQMTPSYDARFDYRNLAQSTANMTPMESQKQGGTIPYPFWPTLPHHNVPGLDDSFSMSPSVSMQGATARPEDPAINSMLPSLDAVALSRQHSAAPGHFEAPSYMPQASGAVPINLPLGHLHLTPSLLAEQAMARTFSAPGAFGGAYVPGQKKQKRSLALGMPSTLSQALLSKENAIEPMDPSLHDEPFSPTDIKTEDNSSYISQTLPISPPSFSAGIASPEAGDPHLAKAYNCPAMGCPKRFARPEHLRRHLKSHSSDRPYRCDFVSCGRTFSRQDNFASHLKIHAKRPFAHTPTNSAPDLSFKSEHYDGPGTPIEEHRHTASLGI